MAASSQKYDVMSSNAYNESGAIPGTGKTVGATGFNFSNGNVVIIMPSDGGMGIFSHELKHAYQFEIGESGFLTREALNNGTSFLHDKTDEVAGYKRGELFGGDSYGLNNLPSEYSNLPTGPVNANSFSPITDALKLPQAQQGQALQNVANKVGAAYRINNTTYYKR